MVHKYTWVETYSKTPWQMVYEVKASIDAHSKKGKATDGEVAEHVETHEDVET